MRGFTLLELMVAVAVFAVVATLAHSGLQVILQTDSHTRARAALLAELQVTLSLLERDLLQVVPVGYRDAFGDRQPPLFFNPLASEPELLLVRAGGGELQGLRRISWRVTESGLERRLWPVLDAGEDRPPLTRIFLHSPPDRNTGEVSPLELEVQFMVQGNDGWQRLDAWPPLVSGTGTYSLPAFIEFRLQVPGFGMIERHWALPAERG